jgi:hypothetical protein
MYFYLLYLLLSGECDVWVSVDGGGWDSGE